MKNLFNKMMISFVALCCFGLQGRSQEIISLAGQWTVRLDEQKTGEQQQWYRHPFERSIHLPGTLDDAGIGKATTLTADELNKEVLLHLTRKHSYIGYAWYAKEVEIPERCAGKNIELFLERVLWATRVWVDGREAGSGESLSAPHRYDLSSLLKPGKHLIVIRIDNSRQYDLSILNMAHAYTDGTQIIWNGVIGKLQLLVRNKAHIRTIQVYPSLKDKTLAVNAVLQNDGPTEEKGNLLLQVLDKDKKVVARQQLEVALPPGETKKDLTFPARNYVQWDEFHPHVYTVRVQLRTGGPNGEPGSDRPDSGRSAIRSPDADEVSVAWGMREISRKNNLLWINGRRLFLRGTLECDIFPLTGHAPMDKKGWLKVFSTAKAYGLNHLRFHSWTPPEAAFEVADSLGFYLQVELPFWNKNAGKDEKMDAFLEEEAYRISREYGSHPSFCLWSMGNELEGDFDWLAALVDRLRQADPRHLYTSTTFSFQPGHGKWPEPHDDYYITQYTRKGWVRGQGIFNTYPPAFTTDYSKAIDSLPIPVIIHEMGQYSVYPRLEEIPKYTGVLDPLNFKAIRNDLAGKDLLELAPAFTAASGKFSANLYKEEIERALKTDGMSGFELLDLHDFPGQGTALIGILDAFWDSKGLVTPAAHRMYCSAVVPLIRYEKAVYMNDETFTAEVEVANFSDHVLKNSISVWIVRDPSGNRVAGGRLAPEDIEIGNGRKLGKFSIGLQGIKKAACLTIELNLLGTSYRNKWKIWVYPRAQADHTPISEGSPTDPIFDTTLEEALLHLRQGRKVLLNPDTIAIKGVAGRFAPVFWSPVHFPNQPGTMGILCDPRHPALAAFPTEIYSDWQWWDLITASKTMILDSLPKMKPIIRVIDNFLKNRNMADVIEVSAGGGKLILVSADITHDLDKRPAARQLRYSLEEYMKSGAFAPSVELSPGQLGQLVASHGEAMRSTTDARIQQAAEQMHTLMAHTPRDSFPETFNPHTGTNGPAAGRENEPATGRWGMGSASSWMSGFYPGSLLYLFETTGDSALYREALKKLKALEKEQYNKDTHDLGFMMYCSFGNADRIAHDTDYTKIMLNSARSLAGRFNEKVGGTSSWNSDPSQFMVIIDNMMNLELLFAATRISGDSSFFKIAVRHANTTMKNHFRPDYSSYHLVIYDPVTGAVKKKQTVQGAANESAWSRGQAWGLYGYTMMYRETGDRRYLDQAEHIADFILPRLPADKIPYWDFDAPGIGGTTATISRDVSAPGDVSVPRDVSAGAIMCSALLELSGYAQPDRKEKYRHNAEAMLESLVSPAYCARPGENGGFLLKHGVGNFPKHSDVDVSLIYGDYYYIEALLRYQRLAGQTQSDTILARYKRYLLNTVRPADNQPADNQPDHLRQWMSSLDPAGQWPDIDYTDTRRAGWLLLEHLARVRNMAIDWSDPRSRYYQDTVLWNAMNRAMDHWLKMRYHNSNWWNNEIGIPRLMRDILVLLHDHMDPSRLTAALQVLGQYRLQKSGAGANLVWSADLGLHFGALAGDNALIKKCAGLMADEIRITTEDGIQPDYSFHQHYARLQMYQYGAAYLQSNIRLAWELKATPWAFPEEKIKLLADFVLNGWQWMARGINTVPGTMDRSASRMNTLHDADLREWIPYLCILYPRAAKEFSAIADRQNGKGTELEGFRYFPYSDFSVYQDPQFSFFLKTLSDRTLASESINSENRKGRLLNSGDAYIIRNGNEYFNLMPVWDWNKLPGVTSFDEATKIDRQSFTGSVSDGKNGMTVMDYRMDGDSEQSLTARKYWACHDGLVVCLIAGLQARGLRGEAFTTLDQCRWQGEVTIGRSGNMDPGGSGSTAKVLEAGDHTIDSVKWIHHAGLATIFLRPARVSLHIGAVTGNWASINASEPATPVTEKVFLPVLLHPGADLSPTADKSAGTASTGTVSTGYVMASRATAEQAGSLARTPSWKIIRNDRDCQAVQFNDGMVMCSFYSKGSLTLSNGNTISADQPCLMLVAPGKLYLSDPSQKRETVVVRVNKKAWTIPLPKDGTTISRTY